MPVKYGFLEDGRSDQVSEIFWIGAARRGLLLDAGHLQISISCRL
jgi:hypothetical protein